MAAVLVALGAALWYVWRRSGPALPGREPPAAGRGQSEKPAPEVQAGEDESAEESAWLQRKVKDLLSKHGVRESHVAKSYTRERGNEDVRWLEETMELKFPSKMNPDAFLKELGAALKKRDFEVLANERNRRRWVLELGRNDRVFERLVFHR